MKKLVLLATLTMIVVGGYSQNVRKVRVRTGGQTTVQNQPSQTKEKMPDKNLRPVLRQQELIPVEISGSLKTMLKSDYMTFCNIPFNLELTKFEDKLEDADFEYEDEQTEDLFFDGISNVDVFSGIFPAMAVTAYIHYTKEKKVYRVELQTNANSDDNTKAMFNNWHKRLQVYVDGGEGDNVDDPIAFSKSGPEIYNITFFPGENCSADVKGWILLRIVYNDKSDSNYDENRSSFVTVDYIDAQNIPADVKAAWGL